MHLSTAFCLGAVAALANAQAYFTMSSLPSDIAPGTNYQLSWLDGQGSSTVSLLLVQGSEQNLATVASIACEFIGVWRVWLTDHRSRPGAQRQLHLDAQRQSAVGLQLRLQDCG
jgi:hypothetical protein